MIKATKLQEEYRRHLNRLNTDCEKSVSISDGDAYINEAIDIIFENLVVKFEINDLVRNHLRQLEVSNYKIIPEVLDKNISKAKYPEDFYKFGRSFIKVCHRHCNIEKTIGLHVVQTADLNKSLKDPYWQPSWEWEIGLAQESGNDLLIYHNCQYDPKEVYIDYIRKPKHIQTPSLTKNGSYTNSSGEVVSQNIDFEIDSTFLWRKIVSLAALNTALDHGAVQDYSLKLQNILTLDKIYLQ